MLRSMSYKILPQIYTMPFQPTCHVLVPCGLGPDLVGFNSFSLAGRYRTDACSNTPSKGLQKIQAARGYDFAKIVALSSDWKKKIPSPSMDRSTADAFTVVNCMENEPQPCFATKYKKKTLLFQHSLRASGILGPISRFRIAKILYLMKLASRASRPGLTVVSVKHPYCEKITSKREEQMCRIACPDEPDSLSYNATAVPR